MYNADSHIEFKTSMLKSSLCDYSDAYIFVSATLQSQTQQQQTQTIEKIA